eukprot:gene5990-1066_t
MYAALLGLLPATLGGDSAPHFTVGGLDVALWPGAMTVRAINATGPASEPTFSFVGNPRSPPQPGCHSLGDLTVRLKPSAAPEPAAWDTYSTVAAPSRG